MKPEKDNGSTITYVMAFLIGAILFWSFGRDWLDLGSAAVIFAGLIGVALAVILFGLWNMQYNPRDKDHKR